MYATEDIERLQRMVQTAVLATAVITGLLVTGISSFIEYQGYRNMMAAWMDQAIHEVEYHGWCGSRPTGILCPEAIDQLLHMTEDHDIVLTIWTEQGETITVGDNSALMGFVVRTATIQSPSGPLYIEGRTTIVPIVSTLAWTITLGIALTIGITIVALFLPLRLVRRTTTRLHMANRDLAVHIQSLEQAYTDLHQQHQHMEDTARQLRIARDEAISANRTKSEFLANMSHELRTPLNAIIGFSDILRQEMFGPTGNPNYSDYAQDIHASGTHLLEIINDILDLSKVEAGRLELNSQVVDLAEELEACRRLVASRARQADLKLTIGAVPKAATTMVADRTRLRQILLNLLSNSIKFTPGGGSIDVTVNTGPGGTVSISVADTGTGMSEEEISLALEPFGQIASTHNKAHQGSGLGLPLVDAYVNLHGGTLEVDSTPCHGTIVTAHFPGQTHYTHDQASTSQSTTEQAAVA